MAGFVKPRPSAAELTRGVCASPFGADPLANAPDGILAGIDLTTPFLVDDQQAPIDPASCFLRLRARGKLEAISSGRLALNSVVAWARDLAHFLSLYRGSPLRARLKISYWHKNLGL